MEKLGLNLLDNNKDYEACKTTQEVLSDLISLRHIDSRIEKVMLFVKFLTLVSWVIFFIGLSKYSVNEEYRLALFSGIITFLLCLSLILVKRKDLENERYESCISLLDLLSEDISSREKIRIKIRFGDLYSKKLEIRKSSASSIYFAPWLSLEGRFVDKTKFKLLGSLKARKRTKKNRRGKVKTKIKFKGNVLKLALIPDPSKSLRLREISRDAKKAVYVPKAYCKLNKFSVTTKKIVIGFISQNLLKQIPPNNNIYRKEMKSNTSEIMMKLFLSGFNIINLSAKLSRSGS